MTTRTPRRGRPPLADIEELRALALTEIERLGYGDVSMAALAEAVGVSVRTLHRYFPAKADIVWGGIESSIEALKEALDQVDDHFSTIDALYSAVLGVFGRDSGDVSILRARLRLIVLSPELRASQSATFEGWREALVDFVARRRGEATPSLAASAVGAAVQTAIMEALSWWAVAGDDRDVAECLAEALGGLRELGA
ncbi:MULTISPECIES: TetR family transcriptional regulator [unclassified Salinibacterium]|uniref:acyl-CoA-like ligand-binding transcription factor n=1 Tax=Salinibacterium sp. GXW1014 TaxID=3377838 RepID=UPI0019EE706A|nr:TetR family transcriptional regulator [Salinibacterium sp.]MBF0672364.1 TetR family transcriptional regulator [Salinibacterium sp.]